MRNNIKIVDNNNNSYLCNIIVIKHKKNALSDYQICLYAALLITLWPLVPTGNFFNNYISIIHYLPIGFLIFSYDKNIYINKP